MKRLVALIVALSMVSALLSIPISAEGAPAVPCSSDTSGMYADFKAYVSASVSAGEEFPVTVEVEGAYEAHILKLHLCFDPEEFEYVSYVGGPMLDQVSELGGVSMLTLSTVGNSLNLGIMMPINPFSGSGTLYTATFRAKRDIEFNDYSFSLIITRPADFAFFPNDGSNTPIYDHSEEILPVNPTEGFNARFFTRSTAKVRPGEDIEVTLNIEGVYRMTGLQIYLNYDFEAFEITEFLPGAVLNAATAAGGYRFEDYEQNPGEVSMIMLLPYADISDEGIIYTLKMHVSDDAEPGEYCFGIELARFVYSAPGTTAVYSIEDVVDKIEDTTFY